MNLDLEQAIRPASDDARPAALKQTSLNAATAFEMVRVNKWHGEFHVQSDLNLKVSRRFRS